MTDYSKRENCPLEEGDIVEDATGKLTDDGEHVPLKMEYIGWPTDGPLFRLPNEPNEVFAKAQVGAYEFAEKWETGELVKLEENND